MPNFSPRFTSNERESTRVFRSVPLPTETSMFFTVSRSMGGVRSYSNFIFADFSYSTGFSIISIASSFLIRLFAIFDVDARARFLSTNS